MSSFRWRTFQIMLNYKCIQSGGRAGGGRWRCPRRFGSFRNVLISYSSGTQQIRPPPDRPTARLYSRRQHARFMQPVGKGWGAVESRAHPPRTSDLRREVGGDGRAGGTGLYPSGLYRYLRANGFTLLDPYGLRRGNPSWRPLIFYPNTYVFCPNTYVFYPSPFRRGSEG